MRLFERRASGAAREGCERDEPRRRRPPRYVRASAVVLPAILAALLYLPSLRNPLVWDDELHVPAAATAPAAELIRPAPGQYARPMVMVSYAAQARLGGASPAALHLFNATIHGAAVALLALLLLRLGAAVPVAAAASILMAAHPLCSAAVAYVSGRTDLLAALFLLAALHVALAERRSGPALAAAGAAALCLLSALSKESGVMAGPAVAALWWHRAWRGRAEHSRPWVAVAALIASGAGLFLVWPGDAVSAAVPPWLRLRAAGTTLAILLRLTLWPGDLHLDRLTPTGGGGAALLGLAFVVAAAGVAAAFLRRPTAPRLAAVLAVLLYLPVCGLIPVHPRIAEHLIFTGEQFAYLPLAPLSALAAGALARWLPVQQRGAIVVASALVLAAAWTPAVLARQHQLADAESVYRTTLAYSPSPRACFNLGNLHLARAQHAQAAAVYERCVRIAPHDAQAHGQLAIAYQHLRRDEDARRAYERAIGLDSGSAALWSNFATLDANQRLYEDARRKWERALEIDPSFAPARESLARLPQR
ncbi:MAG TPA: tetratricopeptide repeat protein [Candidatus Limnocylindrales bacterium]|nr:tetratricopeptide repeat protein [Candidatus Limnocylindrales bacterium]